MQSWLALAISVGSIIASLGVVYGGLKAQNQNLSDKIGTLERKVEKHNEVVERMSLAEQSIKTMWKNIDEIKQVLHELKEEIK